MNTEQDLPRSVLLALWLQGGGNTLDAMRSVMGNDEPHSVEGLAGFAEGTGLDSLFTAWTAGPRQVCALLPAPGDGGGVPAVANHEATEAGECVVITTPTKSWAAVPHIQAFGSHIEPGVMVTWRVMDVPEWSTLVLGTVGSLSEAERALRACLRTATEALDHLDVARWRDSAADVIERIRRSPTSSWPFPPMDGRRARVLDLACRVRAIVACGSVDDGGAVNMWQADQRSTALREVDRTARQAMSAVTYGRCDF